MPTPLTEAPTYPDWLPKLDPEWRTSTVISLAKHIAENADWGVLPILADAVEDAGCAEASVLDHLRGEHRPERCRCTQSSAPSSYIQRISPLKTCKLCKATGLHTLHAVPLHKPEKFPNRNGGCWEGTCWVIQWLLQQPQRVVATFRYVEAPSGDIWEAPVVNPGDACGVAWLVVPAVYAVPPHYAVEARSLTDAMDIFVDSEFGECMRISAPDLEDYLSADAVDSEGRNTGELSGGGQYTSNGTPYDAEQIQVEPFGRVNANDDAFGNMHGRYHGPGIPHGGVTPTVYANRAPCCVCEDDCFLRDKKQNYLCSPACVKTYERNVRGARRDRRQ